MRKKALVLVLLLVSLSFVFIQTGIATDWWNESWSYKKSITFGAVDGASTDYALRIRLHYGAGSDGWEMVGDQNWTSIYLNSHSRADFGDIRAVASNNNDSLSYYLYNITASNVADLYVKDPDNLNSSSSTIYIYYGNAAATTTSSGTDTFLFFDDFENNNFNKWTTVGNVWSINSTWVKNGAYSASAHEGSTCSLQKTWSSTRSVLMHTYFWANDRTMYAGYFFGAAANMVSLAFNSGTGTQWAYYQGSFVQWTAASAGTYTVRTWSEMEVGFSFGVGGNMTGWQNATGMGVHDHRNTAGDWQTDSWTSVGMYEGSTSAYEIFDDYWVRPWVANVPEPIESSIGAEQSFYEDYPLYSDIVVSGTVAAYPVNFTSHWDATELSHWIFSWNGTGTWTNDTAVAFTSTPETVIVTKWMASGVGLIVGYEWYANTTTAFWNSTGILSLTTTAPSVTSPLIYAAIAIGIIAVAVAVLYSKREEDEQRQE